MKALIHAWGYPCGDRDGIQTGNDAQVECAKCWAILKGKAQPEQENAGQVKSDGK